MLWDSKWPDKSITRYDMLDFRSYTKSLTYKYLVIERYMLQNANPRHTFATFKVDLADISIANFYLPF